MRWLLILIVVNWSSLSFAADGPKAKKKKPSRRPASVEVTGPKTLSFNDYLKSNANHPGLASRLSTHQTAFEPAKKAPAQEEKAQTPAAPPADPAGQADPATNTLPASEKNP